MIYSEQQAQRLRGIFFIIVGILLLLYIIGFIQKIGSAILILVSLFLIASGFIEAGFHRTLLRRKNTVLDQ